jgi:hypothetical protein
MKGVAMMQSPMPDNAMTKIFIPARVQGRRNMAGGAPK